MEEFEELKRLLRNKVKNREIPDEVKEKINRIYERIDRIIQQNGVMNATIEDEINWNKKSVNNIIDNSISNSRREGQLENLKYILNDMQRNLIKKEEIQDDDERKEYSKREKQRNIATFTEMDMNSKKDVVRIVSMLEESIGEIKSSTMRILNSRGVSWDKVEQVDYDLRKIMYDVQNNIPYDLMQTLDAEDKEIINEFIEAYEEYEEYKNQKEKEEEKMSRRDKFAKELDAGISLEEQKEFSEKFNQHDSKDKENNNVKSLPDDIFK